MVFDKSQKVWLLIGFHHKKWCGLYMGYQKVVWLCGLFMALDGIPIEDNRQYLWTGLSWSNF